MSVNSSATGHPNSPWGRALRQTIFWVTLVQALTYRLIDEALHTVILHRLDRFDGIEPYLFAVGRLLQVAPANSARYGMVVIRRSLIVSDDTQRLSLPVGVRSRCLMSPRLSKLKASAPKSVPNCFPFRRFPSHKLLRRQIALNKQRCNAHW